MRKVYWAVAIVAVLLSVPGAQASKGSWADVKKIQPGTRISVKTSVRLVCYFEEATDGELICATHRRIRLVATDRELHFGRQRIRDVRLEYDEDTDAVIGAAVGGATGAVVGAAVPGNGTVTRGGSVLLLGLIGAIVGGEFGRDFPITHGSVVYRR